MCSPCSRRTRGESREQGLPYARAFRERYRFNIFGEVFNAFNIANLTGYGFNLDTAGATPTFGQPTGRVGQILGSGGPRAFQVGARFQF